MVSTEPYLRLYWVTKGMWVEFAAWRRYLRWHFQAYRWGIRVYTPWVNMHFSIAGGAR